MADIAKILDCIGPLGPFPPPADEPIEVGRLPVEIEGKWITEYDDLGLTEVHRTYSYGKPETGDE